MSLTRTALVAAMVVAEVWFGMSVYFLFASFMPLSTLSMLIVSIVLIIVLTTWGGVRFGSGSKKCR